MSGRQSIHAIRRRLFRERAKATRESAQRHVAPPTNPTPGLWHPCPSCRFVQKLSDVIPVRLWKYTCYNCGRVMCGHTCPCGRPTLTPEAAATPTPEGDRQ